MCTLAAAAAANHAESLMAVRWGVAEAVHCLYNEAIISWLCQNPNFRSPREAALAAGLLANPWTLHTYIADIQQDFR